MNFSFFYETLRLGLVNLHLHKLRSFLTTLGIVIGVLAVITMLAIGEGGKRETLKAVEQLGATNIILKSVTPPQSNRGASRGGSLLIYGLKNADLDAIQELSSEGKLPDIRMLVPVRDAGQEVVRGDLKANAATIGTTPAFLEVANLSLGEGRFITDDDMANSRGVCVLGAGVAQQLFGREEPIGQTLRIQSANVRAREFEIVGVLKPVGIGGAKASAMTARDLNYDVYFPLTANDAFFSDTIVRFASGTRERKRIELTEIYVRVANTAAVQPTAAALQRMMDIRHASQPDVAVAVPLELIRQAEEGQWLWNIVLGGVAFLSLLIGGIGIMNISLATVTERTREIGIRRALGGKRRHIIMQFLIETMTLSIVGGLVGVGAGVIVPIGITWAVKYFADKGFPTYVTPASVLLSFTISAGVGVLAGLYPAVVAANKDPIESLRHD